MEQEEAIKKEKKVIEGIAKILKETYPKEWNFEIDFVEGDVSKIYILRVKIYKR